MTKLRLGLPWLLKSQHLITFNNILFGDIPNVILESIDSQTLNNLLHFLKTFRN